jgi:hypothetical protein
MQPPIPGWVTPSSYPTVLPTPVPSAWGLGALPPAAPAEERGEVHEEVTQDPTQEDVTELDAHKNAILAFPVMAGSADYVVTIGAYLWAPMTVTQMEFVARYFNNTRRV